MSKQRQALEAARDFLINVKFNGELLDQINEAIAEQEQKQEPFAWAVFDGLGSHFLRLQEGNENFKEEWERQNPKHAGWVISLYTSLREWRELSDQLAGCFRCERT